MRDSFKNGDALSRAVRTIRGDYLASCSIDGCRSNICPREWRPLYTNAADTAADYSMCSPPSRGESCLAITIGLGGEVEFENALAAAGCEVHGFDPTESLRSTHAEAARRHNWTFHNIGLAGSAVSSSNRYGSVGVSAMMLTLSEMVRRVAGEPGGRLRLLKVDCEGCEWQALLRTPSSLLSRVDEFLVELHLTPQYGLLEDETLVRVLGLVSSARLQLFRSVINPGFPQDWFQTSFALRAAGWSLQAPNARNHTRGDVFMQMPCCVNLHFVRREGAAAADELASATGTASLERARPVVIGPSRPKMLHGTLCQPHVDVQATQISRHRDVAAHAWCGAACSAQPGCSTFVFNKYGECYLRRAATSSTIVRVDSAEHASVSCIRGAPPRFGANKCTSVRMLQRIGHAPSYAYMHARQRPYTAARAAASSPRTLRLLPPAFNLAIADVTDLVPTSSMYSSHAQQRHIRQRDPPSMYIGAVRHQNDLCATFGHASQPLTREMSISSLLLLDTQLRPLRGRRMRVACDASGSSCASGYSALAAKRMPVLDLRLVRVQHRLFAHYWVGDGEADYEEGWCLDELRLHPEPLRPLPANTSRPESTFRALRQGVGVIVQVTALARPRLPARNVGILMRQGQLLLLPWLGAPPVDALDARAVHAALATRPPAAHLRTPHQLGEWQDLNGNISPIPVTVGGRRMLLTIAHTHFGTLPTSVTSWGGHYYHLFLLLNASHPFGIEASSPPFCLPVAATARASEAAGSRHSPSTCEAVQFIMSATMLAPSAAAMPQAMLLTYGVHDCHSAVAHVALPEVLRYIRHGDQLRLMDDPHAAANLEGRAGARAERLDRCVEQGAAGGATGDSAGTVRRTDDPPAAKGAGGGGAAQPMVAWDKLTPFVSPGEKQCEWKAVRVAGGAFRQCLRPYSDVVSNMIRQHPDGEYADCVPLVNLWRRLSLVRSDVFIDAGANIGACTLLMASVFDGISLLAFEPNPANLFYLSRSLKENPYINRRVLLYPYGLGASASTFPLYMEAGNAGNSVLNTPVYASVNSSAVVSVVPLDAAFLLDTRQVRLMKVDVQGFEAQLLQGAHHLLASGRIACIKFELAVDWPHGQGVTASELYELFAKYSYAMFDEALSRMITHEEFTAVGNAKLFSDYVACSREVAGRLSVSRPAFWWAPA